MYIIFGVGGALRPTISIAASFTATIKDSEPSPGGDVVCFQSFSACIPSAGRERNKATMYPYGQ